MAAPNAEGLAGRLLPGGRMDADPIGPETAAPRHITLATAGMRYPSPTIGVLAYLPATRNCPVGVGIEARPVETRAR